MRFQKRILLFYAIFATAIIAIFATIYTNITFKSHSDKVNGELKTVADVKVSHLDNLFDNMSAVTTYLLSDQEVLLALTKLAQNDKNLGNMKESTTEFYFKNEVALIRSRLKTYYMLSEFYKVIVFNEQEVVVSNSPRQNINTSFPFDDYPFVSLIKGSGGKPIVIGMHTDDWDKVTNQQVISVIREVQGEGRGYVEVQIREEDFDHQLRFGEEDMEYVVLSTDGLPIYSTDNKLTSVIKTELTTGKNSSGLTDSKGNQYVVHHQASKNHPFVLYTLKKTDMFKAALQEVLPLTILLTLTFFGASFVYIYLVSRHLAKPIRQLQIFMESTQLDNLDEDIKVQIASDEIASLYISYKDAIKRLNESLDKEKKLSILQLQAQFDLLQAQVNPHFIYNVLNVISDRGLNMDDEVICEICSDLSEMMRYSTNIKEKTATIKEEIDYLKLYLTLLQYRYHEKLHYKIAISPLIYKESIPKIILQQLVENSVLHAYNLSAETIEIKILGEPIKNGWFLAVEDQGSGIDEKQKQELQEEMEKVKKKLSIARSNVELQIGGMGLVNTFARLYLLFGERLHFLLLVGREGGTRVEIVVEEEKNVSGDDCR